MASSSGFPATGFFPVPYTFNVSTNSIPWQVSTMLANQSIISSYRSSLELGVKAPAFPLVFYDDLTDVPVVLDFNALPFFQLRNLV